MSLHVSLPRKLAVILLSFFMLFTTGCNAKAKEAQQMIETANQYLLDGNYEEAIAAFNNAIEIDPKQPGAYHGLYSVYTIMNDYVNARDSVVRGIEATGADLAGTTITYRDSADNLEGKDLLIHDYMVITKIMTNPLRIITKEGDITYQADYEYEFDANGRITLLRVKTENGTEETRYSYNDAGIVEKMDRDGIRDYKLSETSNGYKATYVMDSADGRTTSEVEITYDSEGKQLKRSVVETNTDSGERTTVTNSFDYDEDGNLTKSTTSNSAVSGSGTAEYEKGYPTKVTHSSIVMTRNGQKFDTEEYNNQFDQYDRIEMITITCRNSETNESFLWQTTNYFYYDTIGE